MTGRALLAWVLALPPAVFATAGFLWLFAIDLAPIEQWPTFPEGWTLFMFLKHAFALAALAGMARAFRRIIGDLWLEKSKATRPLLPGDHAGD